MKGKPPKQTTHPNIGDRKGSPKKLCDKDFAKRSDELSGAICLKTQLNMTGKPLKLFRKLFGAVRAFFFGFVGPFRLLNIGAKICTNNFRTVCANS